MSLPILCNACNKAKLQGEYHYGDYCTCKPTAADRLTGIRAWVASSNKSTAHHSIKDDGLLYCAELLSIIDARDKELEQVKADHAELVRACELYVSGCRDTGQHPWACITEVLAKLQGSKE